MMEAGSTVEVHYCELDFHDSGQMARARRLHASSNYDEEAREAGGCQLTSERL